MIRADSEFSLDLTLAENVRANSPIENTLPQIKSMDLIKSAEKSGARGQTAVGNRNLPRNQYLILYFFSPSTLNPHFQFDCFILTFPLVQFSRDSRIPLSRFPHALIKIRLFSTTVYISNYISKPKRNNVVFFHHFMIDVFPDFIQSSFNKKIKLIKEYDFFLIVMPITKVSNYSISDFNNKILNLKLKFYNNCAK